ncbi:MAG: Dabb family protein [Fibrobacter sp.]|jgi:exo-beta-1,3-glucanase (GH17 family)|nr:Dabb family protein [Fibrobacter sp.]
MINHIVFWKLKEKAVGKDAIENGTQMVEMLNDLINKVPGIVKMEAGIDFNRSAAAWDVALFSQFKSIEDLNNYQKHPEHIKVGDFIKEVVSSRSVVDYEI